MPLPVKRRRSAVQVTERKLVKALEAVAAGKTMAEAARAAGLGRWGSNALYRRARSDPAFAIALQESRRVGSLALADDLLDTSAETFRRARASKTGKDEVPALREHSRNVHWYAARHNPERFGDTKPKDLVQVVINMSLALSGGPARESGDGGAYVIEIEQQPEEPEER